MKLIPLFVLSFLLLSATATPPPLPSPPKKPDSDSDATAFALAGLLGAIPFVGGFGAGFGGPNGGFAKGGVILPSIVCKTKGPCYDKKLTCPANCFHSFSSAGKNYGVGGGGGGCSFDCEKKCVGYC